MRPYILLLLVFDMRIEMDIIFLFVFHICFYAYFMRNKRFFVRLKILMIILFIFCFVFVNIYLHFIS